MISIVIPNLNSEVIHLTLSALRRQNPPLEQAEILVVGRDDPKRVQKDGLVRFIETPHPVNPAKARNIGLCEAKGDLILFIDADCIPAPDWVSQMVRSHRESGAKIVGGAIEFPRENLWTLADNVAMFRSFLPFSEKSPRLFLPTLNLSFFREVYLAVGEMDETLRCSEDIDWTVRCRKKGYCLHFEPHAVVCHIPTRASFRAVMNHWILTGRYMSEVLVRHQALLGTPSVVRHRWLMLALAPVIAGYLSGRLFWSAPGRMHIYLNVLPLIYLTQMMWCWGMFKGLTSVVKKQE